jgi:hypothetical protein
MYLITQEIFEEIGGLSYNFCMSEGYEKPKGKTLKRLALAFFGAGTVAAAPGVFKKEELMTPPGVEYKDPEVLRAERQKELKENLVTKLEESVTEGQQ